MNYFDYAAATPMSKAVKFAMEPFYVDQFYNPSAQYLAAQNVHKAVERARTDVASNLGARSQEIIFTAGGTEANNVALHGVMARYPKGNCIISAVEHDAVREPASKFLHKIAPVNSDGRINIEALEALIDDKTVLISIMYVNNEIGTVQPLKDIANLLEKVRINRQAEYQKKQNSTLTPKPLPLYFHTDACQAPNYLQVLPNTLGVDLLTLNGGKIYGPKQSGVLFVKAGIDLEPLIYGGGQEKNIRSGTENVAGIIGFATALNETCTMRDVELQRMHKIQVFSYETIKNELPDAIINGSLKHRLPNNIHLTLPGQDNERLMMGLDELGYMVAAGSACSASSDEPSHVLKAIGLSEEAARSSIRITMGRDTTQENLNSLLLEIKKLAVI